MLVAQALSYVQSAWLASNSAVDTHVYAQSQLNLHSHASQQLETYHAHIMPCQVQVV